MEDRGIREVVKLQEDIGLRGITDGEFRRTFFHVDFLTQLDGVGEKGGCRSNSKRPAAISTMRHGSCRSPARCGIHGRFSGYEPVARVLFNELAVDGYFLEYDDARSGDFAPLRHVPKGKKVVLGLLTTKLNRLENIDELRRRIDEAARFMPLEHRSRQRRGGGDANQEAATGGRHGAGRVGYS